MYIFFLSNIYILIIIIIIIFFFKLTIDPIV